MAFSRSLTGSRDSHDFELACETGVSAPELVITVDGRRIASGPISSTSFSIITRLRSISSTEATSVSLDIETGITWLVVAVGSSVTVSRPKRTNNFDSDLYLRGQKKMMARAAHMDSVKQKI